MRLRVRSAPTVLCLLSFLMYARTPLAAQPDVFIHGIVQTQSGAPLGDAVVRLKGTTHQVMTKDDGHFSFSNLRVGTYTLVVSRVGYHTTAQVLNIADDDTTLRIILHEQAIEIPPLVVTGTRTEKLLTATPIKTELVQRAEIERIAAIDLKDVLAEQTGLAIIQDHGAGVQMQGLDPAYTLILIDGEPMVGRTAGTLELSRVSVGDIERVEIVKGPSSSLYGSEALAGVINIITSEPRVGENRLSARLRSRYGSYGTLDLSSVIELSRDKVAASLTLNRKSSSGYDLTPLSISPTAPPYIDYTIAPRAVYQFDDFTTLSLQARFFRSGQESDLDLSDGSSIVRMNEKSKTTDWSIMPKLEHSFNATSKVVAKVYAMNYASDYTLRYVSDGRTYSADPFDQRYSKAEIQFDAALTAQHILTVGGGYVIEGVTAERISGGKHNARSAIAFVQHEWVPSGFLDLVASARFDAHSDYASRLSPKLSTLVSPTEWMKIRLSAGSGFKAPTFQQLYLDFSNPSVGYSVFGSTNVREQLQRLYDQGQIQQTLINPSTLMEIRPEYSVSFNGGVDLTPFTSVSLKINLFYNNLKDMIETAPIAIKTNGQNVFTYFNLSRVVTQGIESELMLKPLEELSIQFGYQYLEAFDSDVLGTVRAGKISKVGATGRIRAVQESEYGGLFNRSQHSGTVKLTYTPRMLGFSASLRGVIRSRYGFADLNGNTILDDDTEYAPGYAVWNLSLSQKAFDRLTIQFGVENMLDKKLPQFVPSMPGRIFFGAVSVSY